MSDALNLLGLIRRAGKLISGTEAVKEGIKNKEVFLILQAKEMNPNVLRSHLEYLENITICREFNEEELTQATGLHNRRLLGITDEGFAHALLKKL